MEHNSDAKNHLAELDEALDQLKINLEAAKQALNEFVQSIGERNNEEIELQKQVEELRRELKQMDTQLANIEAKSKSYSSKVAQKQISIYFIINNFSFQNCGFIV
jgi:chromosome segregation ATPase